MANQETEASQQTRYVRVTGIRNERFVEFDFSIGDRASLWNWFCPFSNLITFAMFTKPNRLSAEQKAQVDLESLKWRYGELDTASPNQ